MIERKKCWYCRKRTPAEGKSTCEECLKKQRKSQRARRAAARKQGVCVRCKFRRPKKGLVTCAVCIAESGEQKLILQENRRLDGLCPLCGAKPDDGKVHCKRCLKSLARIQRGRVRRGTSGRNASKNAERWRFRARLRGLCIICGKRAEKDPVTGELRSMCRKHLDLAAQRARARRKRVSRRIVRRVS